MSGLTRRRALTLSGAAIAGTAATTTTAGAASTLRASSRAYVASPDGAVRVHFEVTGGSARYTLRYGERTVLDDCGMGFRFRNSPPLRDGLAVRSVQRRTSDETWEPVWGKSAHVRNHYNEMVIELQETASPRRTLTVTFRAFDDGVGFRYTFPRQPAMNALDITHEDTEFRFTGDHRAWSIPANYDNYEYLYAETTVSKVGTLAFGQQPRTGDNPYEVEDFESAATPLTVEVADDVYVALHEAALVDYAGMNLARMGGGKPHLRSALVPQKGEDPTAVRAQLPHSTPWRVAVVGDRPGVLLESNLILNLNEPCALGDTSWIRPGKYVGIWWEIHKGKSTWHVGPNLGATTANAKSYIDFASAHGIPYLLVEGWNRGWGSDDFGASQNFLQPNPRFDLHEVVGYGRRRGVELLAHNETGGGVRNYNKQIDKAYAKYERLGLPGVKTGYAGEIPHRYHHDQDMVRHYDRVIREAARHHLMVDAHEPIKPTGLERTYPNFVTREGVRGMEFNAWDSGNPPAHTVTIPFTRMVAGPVDYTPGIFALQWDPEQAEDDTNGTANDGSRVHTTRAHQLALYPVLLSGLQMLADVPQNYEGAPELEFLERVPVTWDETRVLAAEIGRYLVVARRSGTEWYIGCLTDDQPRELEVALDWLGDGAYDAYVYADGPGADWRMNPTPVSIEHSTVSASTTLTVAMASGGGQAIRLAPAGT